MRSGNGNPCWGVGLIFYMKIHQDREKGRKEHGVGESPKLSPKAQNTVFPSLI